MPASLTATSVAVIQDSNPTPLTTPAVSDKKPLPTLQIHVPDNTEISETSSEPTTVELILSARAKADVRAREVAKAAGIVEADGGPEKSEGSLRLPHLREPTKEPEPTDPDFTVRLGAFLERAGDDCFPRLLQREFPEPKSPQRRPQRSHSRLSSTPSPSSPLSPTLSLSPALSPITLSPAVSPREIRWSPNNQGEGGKGRGGRKGSLTVVRRLPAPRRDSAQFQKGAAGHLLPQTARGSYLTESES
ncbi:hypothetical protein ACOMHN_017780 [Nucella lapillus]